MLLGVHDPIPTRQHTEGVLGKHVGNKARWWLVDLWPEAQLRLCVRSSVPKGGNGIIMQQFGVFYVGAVLIPDYLMAVQLAPGLPGVATCGIPDPLTALQHPKFGPGEACRAVGRSAAQ